MSTRSTDAIGNRRRTSEYRRRLRDTGVTRVEVRIPARDVPLVHGVVGILRAGGDEADVLREQLRQVTGGDGHATGKDLVAFLRSSPLAGVELNLERDKTTGRTISLGQ